MSVISDQRPGVDVAVCQEWDRLVEHTQAHYTQTSMWAEVKKTVGWTSERVRVTRDGRLVGGAQALLRSVPILGQVALVPSDPVVLGDEGVIEEVVDELLRLCARQRVVWLKLQPTSWEGEDLNRLEGILRERRFIRNDFRARDAATMSVKLDSDPERVIASLRPALRANIRRAQRKGQVKAREGGEDDLGTFADLLALTAARQPGMPLFPRAYYVQVWRSFVSRGRGRLLLAEHRGRPLSAIMLVTHGDTCVYLYGGWNRERPDLHPNELLQWSAIEWACRQGFQWYDLGMIERAVAERLVAGERVPTNATTGQTRYKLGFNGHVTLTAPSYDQTGRRLLRPAIRLISPRLRLVSPLGNRLRGLRASHQTAYVREERVRELPSREG